VTIDWTKPIEAVREGTGETVRLTVKGRATESPGREGYETIECPNPDEANRCWNPDGTNWCHVGLWKVRNVAEPEDVPLPSTIDWDRQLEFEDTGGRAWLNGFHVDGGDLQWASVVDRNGEVYEFYMDGAPKPTHNRRIRNRVSQAEEARKRVEAKRAERAAETSHHLFGLV